VATIEAPGRVYERFLLELWHAEPGRLAELAERIIDPDFVIRRNGDESALRGPSAIVDTIEQSLALFDDIEVTLDIGPIVDGDLASGRWTFAGTYRGGIPGTSAEPGTRVAFSGIDIVRVAGGKVVAYWVSADGEHLARQLGAGE
jgi:predicted ester cyclase